MSSATVSSRRAARSSAAQRSADSDRVEVVGGVVGVVRGGCLSCRRDRHGAPRGARRHLGRAVVVDVPALPVRTGSTAASPWSCRAPPRRPAQWPRC
ncbi:hypothetical protein J7E95_26085 [Streptomyces sp. ISL-14]|nr:hypothetical protein [Streptomyces sp. ISL-14]